MRLQHVKIIAAIALGLGGARAGAADAASAQPPALPLPPPYDVRAPLAPPRPVAPTATTPVSGLPREVPLLTSGPLQVLESGILAWDSDVKEVKAKPGETHVTVSFSLTNVSPSEVSINYVRTSCGCTIPRLPSQPWKLAPGERGDLPFVVDIRGKSGLLTKVANIETSKGFKALTLRVDIPALPAMAGGLGDRMRNLQIAAADRQAVFKGDCAACHVAPAEGKHGEVLFQAACAICHEAEHRATMVPDLKALKTATDKDYWRNWVTAGKAGGLMPAFAKAQGGPLTDEQIDSLVEFLTVHFKGQSSDPATPPTSAVAKPETPPSPSSHP